MARSAFGNRLQLVYWFGCYKGIQDQVWDDVFYWPCRLTYIDETLSYLSKRPDAGVVPSIVLTKEGDRDEASCFAHKTNLIRY